MRKILFALLSIGVLTLSLAACAPTPTTPPISTSAVSSGKIAFDLMSPDFSTSEIYTLDLAAGTPVKVTTGLSLYPSWSPDGKQIAYYGLRGSSSNIYSMNADGTNIKTLTAVPGADITPSFSADGKKIAFVTFRDNTTPTNQTSIYIMNADGSNPKRLIGGEAIYYFPHWSPDGSMLVFGSNLTGDQQIYTVKSDGTGLQTLTKITPGGNNIMPVWSPDGGKIVFVSNRDADQEIYTMNPDGSNQTRLTNVPGNDSMPSWSPDGKSIIFVSARAGASAVYIMDRDGSNQTLVFQHQFTFEWPVWTR